jgi:hypothetical protein
MWEEDGAGENDYLGCDVWFGYEFPRLGADQDGDQGSGHFEKAVEGGYWGE